MASVSSKRRQKFARRTQPSQSKGLSAAVMNDSESKMAVEEVSQGLEGVTTAIDEQAELQNKIAKQQLAVFKQLLKATIENKPFAEENKATAIEPAAIENKPAAIENKSAGITSKLMSGGFGAAVQTAKDVASQKITNVKKLLTPEGLAQAAAGAAGGGLTSTIFGGVAEHFKSKREEGTKSKEWKESFLTGTERGRALVAEHGQEGAEKRATQAYEEHKTLTEGVQTLEAKQRKIKSSGIAGADLGEADLAELADKKQKLEGIGKASREEYVGPIAKAVAGAAGAEMSKQGGALADNEQFLSGIEAGAVEELQKVSVEQLAVLKKILASTEKTEEDAIEQANKEKKSELFEGVKPEPEKKEEKKGLMSTLIDAASSLAGGGAGLLSKGASIAKGAGSKLLGAGKFLKGTGKLLPGIGTALAVGGGALDAAGAYSDYEEGKITEQERNAQMGEGGGGAAGALAGAATGAALGSAVPIVGTAIGGILGGALGYWGGGKIGSSLGGMFGSDQKKGAAPKIVLPPEDAAKSKAADIKAAIEYQKASPEEKAKILETTGASDEELNAAFSKLPKIILPPEDAAKSKAADVKATKEYQTASQEEKAKIQETTGASDEELNAAFSKLLKNKPIDADTEKLLVKNGYEVPDYLKIPPPPTAANQPLRNMQTAALEQSTATVNDAKLQPPIAKEMAKSVNSTNVINNNTNTTVVRPEVRTAEPSFNRVLANNFSF